MAEQIGSYKVVRQLGKGGMGVVLLGEHERLGHLAAIKLLRPELSTDPELVRRFFNEARAATHIRHPGIVKIFDFGNLPDGAAYFIMEYLEGESLGARLAARGRFAAADIVAVARQIGGALAAAHQAGIIHRDLKPDNLFFVADPDVPGGERVKVLDFGIAKLAGDLQATAHTRAGSLMGTPFYMSPEQCHGAEKVDARSDIYAVACILYEMACGQPPFTGDGLGEIIGKHQFVAPVPPRTIAPELPEALERAILHGLAKDPAARPQTLGELVRELDPAGGSLPPAARVPSGPAPPIVIVKVAPTIARAATEATRPPSHRAWPIAAIVVLVAGGGTIGLMAAHRDGPPEAVAPATGEARARQLLTAAIDARGGEEKLRHVRSIKYEGTLGGTFDGRPYDRKISRLYVLPDRVRYETDSEGSLTVLVVAPEGNTRTDWHSDGATIVDMPPAEVDALRTGAWNELVELHATEPGVVVEDAGQETVFGQTADIVVLRTADAAREIRLDLDPTTHLVVRARFTRANALISLAPSDWRPVDGVLMPYRMHEETPNSSLDRVATLIGINVALKSDTFTHKPDAGLAPAPATAPASRLQAWIDGPLLGNDNNAASMRAAKISRKGAGLEVWVKNQSGFRCKLEIDGAGDPATFIDCVSTEEPASSRWSASPRRIAVTCRFDAKERAQRCSGRYDLHSESTHYPGEFQLYRKLAPGEAIP